MPGRHLVVQLLIARLGVAAARDDLAGQLVARRAGSLELGRAGRRDPRVELGEVPAIAAGDLALAEQPAIAHRAIGVVEREVVVIVDALGVLAALPGLPVPRALLAILVRAGVAVDQLG